MLSRVRVVVASVMLVLGGCPKDDEDTSAEPTSTGSTDGSGGETGGATGGGTTTGGGDGPQYCPGVPEIRDPCVVDSDCPPGGSYCAPFENDCPGAGCAALCQVDADCGEQAVCVFQGTGCCAGQASLCVAACTPESCAPGEACLPDGHCAPITCDGGYACPEGWSCAPGANGADGHGCVQIPCDQPGATACGVVLECVAGTCQRLDCQTNADCPCGTCVQGKCWERPWLCTENAP